MKTRMYKLAVMLTLGVAVGFFASCAKDYDDDIRKLEQQVSQNHDFILSELEDMLAVAKAYADQLNALQQADLEGQMRAQKDALQGQITQLEIDLLGLQNTLRLEMLAQKGELEGEITQLNIDLLQAIATGDNTLRIELEGKIAAVQTNLDNLESDLNQRIQALESNLNGQISQLSSELRDLIYLQGQTMQAMANQAFMDAVNNAQQALEAFRTGPFAMTEYDVAQLKAKQEVLTTWKEQYEVDLARIIAYIDTQLNLELAGINYDLNAFKIFLAGTDYTNVNLMQHLQNAIDEATANAAAALLAYRNGSAGAGNSFSDDLKANLPDALNEWLQAQGDDLDLTEAYNRIKSIEALNDFKTKFEDDYQDMLDLLINQYGQDLGTLFGLTDMLLNGYAASNGTTLTYEQIADWVADAKTQYNEIAAFFMANVQGYDFTGKSASDVMGDLFEYVVTTFETMASNVEGLGTSVATLDAIVAGIGTGQPYEDVLSAIDGQIAAYFTSHPEIGAAVTKISGIDAWIGTGTTTTYASLNDYVSAIIDGVLAAEGYATQTQLSTAQTELQIAIDEMKNPFLPGSLANAIADVQTRLAALEARVQSLLFTGAVDGAVKFDASASVISLVFDFLVTPASAADAMASNPGSISFIVDLAQSRSITSDVVLTPTEVTSNGGVVTVTAQMSDLGGVLGDLTGMVLKTAMNYKNGDDGNDVRTDWVQLIPIP